MTNSYRNNLIGIWLIVLGLEGILASLYVFNIPSMQKNAFLFGFSQMRLISGGGFLLFSMLLLVVAGLVMIDKFDLTIWIQKSNKYLASGDHLFYFSEKTLKQALEQFDLQVIHCSHVGYHRGLRAMAHGLLEVPDQNRRWLNRILALGGSKDVPIYLNLFDILFVVAQKTR